MTDLKLTENGGQNLRVFWLNSVESLVSDTFDHKLDVHTLVDKLVGMIEAAHDRADLAAYPEGCWQPAEGFCPGISGARGGEAHRRWINHARLRKLFPDGSFASCARGKNCTGGAYVLEPPTRKLLSVEELKREDIKLQRR